MLRLINKGYFVELGVNKHRPGALQLHVHLLKHEGIIMTTHSDTAGAWSRAATAAHAADT